eukprot:COSAG05_NODE_12097_length_483_cov_1.315104_1_plen_32_part_01
MHAEYTISDDWTDFCIPCTFVVTDEQPRDDDP